MKVYFVMYYIFPEIVLFTNFGMFIYMSEVIVHCCSHQYVLRQRLYVPLSGDSVLCHTADFS